MKGLHAHLGLSDDRSIFTPASLSGLGFWVAGDVGFTSAAWTALAGPNVTQATQANQPSATTLNGRAAVLFNQASTQWMFSSSGGPASADQAHTILVAGQYSSVSTSGFSGTVGWGGSNTGLGSSTIGTNPNGGSPLWWYGGSNSVINGSVIDTSAHVWGKTFDGSNVVGYEDFVSNSAAGSVTMAMGSGVAVGAYLIAPGSASGSSLTVGEVIVYERVLSAGELSKLHTYLTTRWGTP